MPTKAELKQLATHIKVKVRKGDQVMIIAGKDKGQIGIVAAVAPKEQKVLVVQPGENEGEFLPLNAAIKHRKARFQGEKSSRLKIPVQVNISNVMVIDPTTGKPSRLGRKKVDGKTVRYAKKSGEVIPDAEVMEKA